MEKQKRTKVDEKRILCKSPFKFLPFFATFLISVSDFSFDFPIALLVESRVGDRNVVGSWFDSRAGIASLCP